MLRFDRNGREGRGLQSYVHRGTGNDHPVTAKVNTARAGFVFMEPVPDLDHAPNTIPRSGRGAGCKSVAA